MNLKGGFEDYKINTKNMPLKFVGFIVFLLIAVTAISIGVSKIIEKPEGYYDIKEYPCEDAPGYGNRIELNYYLSGKSGEIKELNNRVEEVYSHSLERAYKLLDPVNEYENYVNIAYLNNNPGKSVEISDELLWVLQDAYSKTLEKKGYSMFAGPLYAHWNSILILDEELEFDPINNSEEAKRISNLSKALSDYDQNNITISEKTVTFTPDLTFVDFIDKNEESTAIIDLNLLKDSYIVKIVSDALEEAGFSNGYITTQSGIVHNLSKHQKGEFAFYSVDKLEKINDNDTEKTPVVKMAGVREVKNGSTLSGFRMFKTLDKEDLYHVVESQDGDILRSPFINLASGTYNYYDSIYAVSDDNDVVTLTYELVKIINSKDIINEHVVKKEDGVEIYLFKR